jgi:hypothetical protein
VKDQRGAIYVETLIGFLPVFLFFLGCLHIADASAASLIVRHAATVAARAAVVVMPDDGMYYNDQNNNQVHQFTGLRRQDIEHAADLILGASPRLDHGGANVQIGFKGGGPQPTPPPPPPPSSIGDFFEQLLNTSTKGDGGDQGMRDLLTAHVTTHYHCLVPVFCAGGYDMAADASLVYQGARYVYEPWPDSLHEQRAGEHEGGHDGDGHHETGHNPTHTPNHPGSDADSSPHEPVASNGQTHGNEPGAVPSHGQPANPGSNTATSTTTDAARTPHNETELRNALSPKLRDIPIVRDPSLHGSTVRVAYTHNDRGVITGIEVHVGDGAQARHIAGHVNTITTMQRYQGLSGRVRALLDRFNQWLTGHPSAGPGTLAWETRNEVEKLQGLVDARANELSDPDLTPEHRRALERELNDYEQQLREHLATAERVTNEPGRGYVAAEDSNAQQNVPPPRASELFPGISPGDAQAIDELFRDHRNPDGSPTNPESRDNPPPDLADRIAQARERATQASGQAPSGGVVAVGSEGPQRNGWSNRDLTSVNYAYTNIVLGRDQPGGQNDPALDGDLVPNRGDKNLLILTGAAAASHAEQLLAIANTLDGKNEPIGVSQAQCGECRNWFREHAMQQQQTYVVDDTEFTRVYYPNGQVDVYDHDGNRVATADTETSVSLRNYKGIPWDRPKNTGKKTK